MLHSRSRGTRSMIARKCATLLASLTLLLTAAAPGWAQSQPDSAAIYERMALKAAEANSIQALFRNARRALALYEERNDNFGRARLLVQIANGFSGQGRPDSAFLYTQRAFALRQYAGSDSTFLADISGLMAEGFMKTMGSMDSAAVYRARAVRLYRRLPSRLEEGRALVAFGDAFTWREQNDAAFNGKKEMLDSALAYLHNSIGVGRQANDSITISGSYGLIANIWQRRNRLDSTHIYRTKAFEISSRLNDPQQMSFDVRAIVSGFTRSQVDTRATGIARNLDSAVYWSRRHYELTARFGMLWQLPTALALSRMHTLAANADSARYYIDWTIANARAAKIPQMEANATSELAIWYEGQGFADSALTIRREFERQARTTTGQRTIGVLSAKLVTWARLVDAHSARGNLDSALFWSRNLLDSARSDTLLSFRTLAHENIARVFLQRGLPDSAMTQYQEIDKEQTASSDRLAPPSIRTLWRADSWSRTANVMYETGHIDSAQALNELILKDARTSVNSITPARLLGPLESLAKIERFRGQADSALALDRVALAITLDQTQPIAEARVHQALGEDFDIRGSRDSALVHYRAAVNLDKSRQFRPNAVSRLGALASWYVNADAPDSALALNRRAAALAARTSIPGLMADVRFRTGIAYGALGQWDSAVVNLEAAMTPKGPSTLSTIVALAAVRLRMGQTDTAAALLRTALREYRTSKAKPAIARTLALLSYAEILLARPDSARAFATEALTLAREAQDVLTEGRALAAIGRAQFALGQSSRARADYEAALAVFVNAGFKRDARETLAELAELFRVRGEIGDLAIATAYFDSAAATVDNARRRTGDDENAVAFAEQETDMFGAWSRAWLGRRNEVGASRGSLAALGAVERGRAQSLLDLLHGASSNVQDAGQVVRAGADLAAEADSLLAPVRAVKGAALSYLHAGDTLFVWFAAPDGGVEVLPARAITAAELTRIVRSARTGFGADDARSGELNPDELRADLDSTSAKRSPADDLKRLAELLLPADLHKRVPAGTPIIIVPHGAIALVPFAALESGSRDSTMKSDALTRLVTRPGAKISRSELGLRNPLRYAPSFAALRATDRTRGVAQDGEQIGSPGMKNRSRPVAAPSTSRPTNAQLTQSLVVGNPTMPYVYSGRANNRAKLRPLPGAEAESRTIAQRLGTRPLTGAAATETAVRSRMARAPLIHFATHGLGYGTRTSARRSYVAFAPDAKQDGLLTLGELMDDKSLTLRADLVVLSACQTGLGDLKKAEGSIGLQRAFLAKGARSVLVSLWNVDDRATRLLMEKFYAYWLDPLKPRSKAEALQMAQEVVMSTPGFADPRYWAAFQLVGGN